MFRRIGGVTAVDTVPARNITLRPVITARSYSITYNLDGGTVADENPTSYNIDSGDITLHNPTKEGYEFTGWTGSNGFMPSKSVTIQSGKTGDLSFTANWEEISSYSLTYNLAGGTLESENPTEYRIDSDSFTLNNPSRVGYEFLGWTLNDGNTPQLTVTIEKGSRGDRSYTAQWKANTYTVVFDSNGSFGSMTSQTFTYDEAQNLKANTYSYSPYTFLGWAINENGLEKYVDKESVKNLATSGTVTLYARFDNPRIKFTINDLYSYSPYEQGTSWGKPDINEYAIKKIRIYKNDRIFEDYEDINLFGQHYYNVYPGQKIILYQDKDAYGNNRWRFRSDFSKTRDLVESGSKLTITVPENARDMACLSVECSESYGPTFYSVHNDDEELIRNYRSRERWAAWLKDATKGYFYNYFETSD